MDTVNYPFHPAGKQPGGVVVEQGQVVLRDETGAVMAHTTLPADIRPGDLYRQGRLFDLFPAAEWYIGRPWQAVVDFQLVRVERQRLVDGALSFQVGGQTDGPYAWTAEVIYSENGPVWQIDAPLPAGIDTGDIGLRLAISAAIYRIIGGPPAAGRPGETTSAVISNTFCREILLANHSYLTRWVATPPAASLQLFAAKIDQAND